MVDPSNHTELSCEYMSTCGLSFLCDQTITHFGRYRYTYGWNPNVTEECTIVYSHSRELNSLIQMIDDYKMPIIIMVNGDDYLAPMDYPNEVQVKIETNPNVLAVFAQNCCTNDPASKWKHLPIGLDYHTLLWSESSHLWGKHGSTALEQEQLLKSIQAEMVPIHDTNGSMVVTNFHLAMGGPYRRTQLRPPIYDACKHTPWIKWLPEQSREDFWRSCNEAAFVLCPPGNGYDTHRAWEALCLGRIPIIQDLPINEVYRDLPVWIVNDWNNFANLTASDVERVWSEMISKWNEYKWEKLKLQYWKKYLSQMKDAYRQAPMNS